MQDFSWCLCRLTRLKNLPSGSTTLFFLCGSSLVSFSVLLPANCGFCLIMGEFAVSVENQEGHMIPAEDPFTTWVDRTGIARRASPKEWKAECFLKTYVQLVISPLLYKFRMFYFFFFVPGASLRWVFLPTWKTFLVKSNQWEESSPVLSKLCRQLLAASEARGPIGFSSSDVRDR